MPCRAKSPRRNRISLSLTLIRHLLMRFRLSKKGSTPVHCTKSDRQVLEPPEHNEFQITALARDAGIAVDAPVTANLICTS